jgi:hypothetical protein
VLGFVVPLASINQHPLQKCWTKTILLSQTRPHASLFFI